ALRVDQDDDLLAFLPADNPAVADFQRINREFGGLDVAIVGIEAGDPFAGPFLETLDVLTRKLGDEATISLALSLSNVEDFSIDEEKGGIRAEYLARPAPKTPEASRALRERVMGKEHIVGNLVSRDGRSVIIYAFLAPDANPRATADFIKGIVKEAYPDLPTYWGGAPFISTYIYDVTQADMRRLIPWAVVVIVLIIVASFRDVFGALLALVSTAMGIVITYGLMGMNGVDANIVLGAMPVILFAVGSAYPIHVLVRYYALRGEHDAEDALAETLVGIGPVVLAAGLTTVAGLMSFLAMDIAPMRSFGLYTGLGILATLLLSLTFVPAVVRVVGLESRSFSRSWARDLLVAAVRGARARRAAVTVGLLVVTGAGLALAGRVEARMETAAFFEEGSPPDRAEDFLRTSFGGSQFIQVMVEGDMNDPGVLREVQRLADRIAVEPHVSSVASLAQVLSLLNEAFTGERRLPPTTAQVRVLYRFLQGRPVLEQFLVEDRTRSLMQIKIDTDEHEVVAALLDRIEALVAEEALRGYRVVGRPPASAEAEAEAVPELTGGDEQLSEEQRAEVTKRRLAVAAARVAALLSEARSYEEIINALADLDAEAEPKAVQQRLAGFLTSRESFLPPDLHGRAVALATTLAGLGPSPTPAEVESSSSRVLVDDVPLPEDCVEDPEGSEEATEAEGGGACAAALATRAQRREVALDLALSLSTPLDEAWRRARADGRARALLGKLKLAEPKALRPFSDALLDLDTDHALIPKDPSGQMDGELRYVVTGTPVLYRGLSESVTQNQIQSLGLALALVLVIMVVLFRSVSSGLLAATPTVITLSAIYGAMGALGLHLDIGTSMLASIIIGAGVDYAVHLLAAWRADEGSTAAGNAAEHAGPAIWTNAIMVSAGFFVLTLGDAKPLENVGGLTSAAMLVAAMATFVAIPALARKLRYRK
ncbi:MAG TPA: hypothetical protein ENK57_18015, partial [Polyangiaceae bacterium]|nr:hypothetical protein [Polyangiaceae bacterium]